MERWQQWTQGDEEEFRHCLRQATRRNCPVLLKRRLRSEVVEKIADKKWEDFSLIARYASTLRDRHLQHLIVQAMLSAGVTLRCGESVIFGADDMFRYPVPHKFTLAEPLEIVHPVPLQLHWTYPVLLEHIAPWLECLVRVFGYYCPDTDLITDAYLEILETLTSNKPQKCKLRAAKLVARATNVIKSRMKRLQNAYAQGVQDESGMTITGLGQVKLVPRVMGYVVHQDLGTVMPYIFEGYKKMCALQGEALRRDEASLQFFNILLGFDPDVTWRVGPPPLED
jgi:hypothetical protein